MFRQILPLLSIGLVSTFIGCGQSTSDDTASNEGSPDLIDVAVQLNWYPESEHGGVYQALADGTYDSAGLNVDIRPGGVNTPVAAELELGRAQFAIVNADDVILQRRQGADIVAVAAVVQHSPRCILVHQSTGITDFDGLEGMTFQRQAGRSFLQFMRQKGVLDQVKEVPYMGSVASFVSDPNIAIQGYLFSEPLMARQAGVDVNILMVSDLGWDPYSSVLVTTGDLIRQKPKMVQKVVDATLTGWRNYLSDATVGNKAILAANRHGMTAETLQFGVAKLSELALPNNADRRSIGSMSDQRWTTLVQQMDALEPGMSSKVTADQCYTLQFIQDVIADDSTNAE